MKRKLLVIAGLLGSCLVVGVNRPALAYLYPFCSSSYCATVDPGSYCTCPPGTEAYKRLGPNSPYYECYTWQADCNYM
jgi:hypothetical protein